MNKSVKMFALGLAIGLCACSSGATTGEGTDAAISGGADKGSSEGTQAGGANAFPQEELARTPDAIKLSGTITVKDYESGLLQIDCTTPTDAASPNGVPPITVARFKTPGPFELFLPPKTEAVNLSLILDLKGNGPDAEDPKTTYAKNPIKIDGKEVTGIELEIEKSAVSPPPPTPPGGTGDAAAGTGTAAATDAAASPAGAGTGAAGAGTGAAGAGTGAATASSATSSSPAATGGSSSAPSTTAAVPAATTTTGAAASTGTSGKTAADPLDESLDGAPGK